MTMTVEATVTTPPYDTGEVDGNGQPIMATDSTVVTEQHDINVEFAPETELFAASTSEPDAAEPMMMASDTSTDDAAMISGLEAPADPASETETEPTATDPYLQLTDPTQTEPAASTEEPSPTDPYLALTSPETTATSTNPTTTESTDPATTQDPLSPDQLYADTQTDNGDTLDAPTTETQPEPEPSVPPPTQEEPLPTTHY
jgi:hypothetical protein